jgi:hypothetical protein
MDVVAKPGARNRTAWAGRGGAVNSLAVGAALTANNLDHNAVRAPDARYQRHCVHHGTAPATASRSTTQHGRVLRPVTIALGRSDRNSLDRKVHGCQIRHAETL